MHLKNMNLIEFLEYIREKDFFCIGAGKLLQDLYTYTDFEVNIQGVLDNSKEKQLNGVPYKGTKIEVKPLSFLSGLIKNPNRTVMLITASAAGGGMALYKKIMAMDLPDEVECFFFNFIMAEPMSIVAMGGRLNFQLVAEPLIPKTIHYCWFGGGEIPDWQMRLIQGWKEKCPDFDVVRWDESNYDVRQNKYIAKAYNEGKWAFVSDYARKDVIYRYGGIYLDVDVEIIKPLNDLIFQKGFFGIMPDWRVGSGLGFGAVPNLEIIREMRDIYDDEDFLYKDVAGMKVAPDYETDILEHKGYKKNGNIQYVSDVTIYPAEVLSGTLPYSNKRFITENTYTVHHYAGSWTEWERKRKKDKAIKLYEKITSSNNMELTDE